MNIKGSSLLAEAVIKAAISDWEVLNKELQLCIDNQVIRMNIEKLQEFFNSEWFYILCSLSKSNPDFVREKLRGAST